MEKRLPTYTILSSLLTTFWITIFFLKYIKINVDFLLLFTSPMPVFSLFFSFLGYSYENNKKLNLLIIFINASFFILLIVGFSILIWGLTHGIAPQSQ